MSDAARADLVAANDAFAKARAAPLGRDTGDSRVPGFVAAAKFGLGVVQNDAALQAEGLADLEAAVAVNAFFNVFDLIPVVQALPPRTRASRRCSRSCGPTSAIRTRSPASCPSRRSAPTWGSRRAISPVR